MQTMKAVLGILIGFWLVVSGVMAESIPLKLSVLADSEGVLSIDAVANRDDLSVLRGNSFSGGYTRKEHWFKLDLKPINDLTQEIMLEIHPTYLDDLRCYYQDEQGRWVEKKTGDHYPFGERDLPYRGFTFVLPASVLAQPIWIRLQTTSSSVFNIKAWSSVDSFQQDRTNEYFLLGVYYGFLLLLLVVNVGIAFFTKDIVFYLFFVYLFFSTSLTLSTNAIWAEFLFPNYPLLTNYLTMYSTAFVFISAGFFYEHIMLVSRKHTPIIFWLNRLGIALSSVILLSIVMGFYELWMPIAMNFIFFMLLFWLFQAVRIWRTKQASFWLLMAHVMTLMGGVIAIFSLNGLITGDFWFINGFQMGSLGTVLALQIVMIQRIASIYQTNAQVTARAELAEFHHRQQDSFLSMLTHELKTPLSIINMVLANPNASERIKQHAITSVQNICDIVDHCTKSQRLTYHNYQLQIEPINLQNLVNQQLQYRPLNKPVEWQLETPEVVCAGDLSYLKVIVNNLFTNAEKYAKEGTTIVIVVSEHHNDVCLSVRNQVDTRSLPDANKLYEAYYRAPSAQKVSGSGLGLFIVKSLVERLSGKVIYDVYQDVNDLHWVSFSICLSKVPA